MSLASLATLLAKPGVDEDGGGGGGDDDCAGGGGEGANDLVGLSSTALPLAKLMFITAKEDRDSLLSRATSIAYLYRCDRACRSMIALHAEQYMQRSLHQ